jgi:hypothetical protein
MNKKIFKMRIVQLIFLSAAAASASCSNSPESVYERMLDKYEAGKGGNITLMAEKFLMVFFRDKSRSG